MPQGRDPIGDGLRAHSERQKAERDGEKVVWLLGSGFSRPLGGPLFADLLSHRTGNWVQAWLDERGASKSLQWIPEFFARGVRQAGYDGYWDNAEECLALIEDGTRSKVAEGLIRKISQAFGADVRPVGQLHAEFSQFVAVATSYFVDDVDINAFPEIWSTYWEWMRLLGPNDHVVSFNYDRVLETLAQRALGFERFSKLHGDVPPRAQLMGAIKNGSPIDSIGLPGISKFSKATTGPLEPRWAQADAAIAEASRLVVIGYSFPASDPYARSRILTHCKNLKRVTIVLGTDAAAERCRTMFEQVLPGVAIDNSLMLAQEYLVAGIVNPLLNDRFGHPTIRSKTIP